MIYYVVKIKKGVRPYGGRRFIAKPKEPPHSGWYVDVQSSPKAPTRNYSHWTFTFGNLADWRSYRDHEIEVITESGVA